MSDNNYKAIEGSVVGVESVQPEVFQLSIEADKGIQGKLLFDIEQSKLEYCGFHTEKVKIAFYDNLFVVTKSSKVCCFPESFSKIALPKYRVIGVKFSRPKLHIKYIVLGLVLIIIGAAIVKSNPAAGGILILVGVIILFYGVIKPFCAKYVVRFYLSKKQSLSYIENSFGQCCTWSYEIDDVDDIPSVIEVKLSTEPDTDKILNYVYGTLNERMDQMHSLVHLLDDDVVKSVTPKSLLAAVGEQNC